MSWWNSNLKQARLWTLLASEVVSPGNWMGANSPVRFLKPASCQHIAHSMYCMRAHVKSLCLSWATTVTPTPPTYMFIAIYLLVLTGVQSCCHSAIKSHSHGADCRHVAVQLLCVFPLHLQVRLCIKIHGWLCNLMSSTENSKSMTPLKGSES